MFHKNCAFFNGMKMSSEHLDHSLNNENSKLKILTHEITRILAQILLHRAAYISNKHLRI